MRSLLRPAPLWARFRSEGCNYLYRKRAALGAPFRARERLFPFRHIWSRTLAFPINFMSGSTLTFPNISALFSALILEVPSRFNPEFLGVQSAIFSLFALCSLRFLRRNYSGNCYVLLRFHVRERLAFVSVTQSGEPEKT